MPDFTINTQLNTCDHGEDKRAEYIAALDTGSGVHNRLYMCECGVIISGANLTEEETKTGIKCHALTLSELNNAIVTVVSYMARKESRRVLELALTGAQAELKKLSN